jgi:carboxypeptidase Taq
MIGRMGNANDTYSRLMTTIKEINLLSSAGSVLHWDQETHLPDKGHEHRGDQVSLIARLTHQQFTSPQIGQMIGEIEQSELVKTPDGDAAANIRELRRTYDRATKLPASLVEEMSKTAVLAHHAWVDARKNSNYDTFKPWLAKTLDLKRQEVACINPNTTAAGTAYDTLLDEYEPGETTANLNRVFETLRAPLIDLVGRIGGSSKKAPLEILEQTYPAAAQEKLALEAAAKVGFDFAAGRLDVSVHPFCTGLGPRDIRITTRYDEKYFGDAFFGVLHETGHALYEQGLPTDHWGTPLGEAISLGIHESQSRLWENLVGRSKSFWQYFYPQAQAAFGSQLKDVTLDRWHFAINDVRPSLIRTESDEATYNLHILIRFELEQALLAGDLPVDDLPNVWNERMKKYLGVTPPDAAKGCLQDTHWSGGAIGYFPTYTLGNLYAAQFFEQAKEDLGDLDAQFSRGDFTALLGWLREKIHRHGKRYRAPDLVQRITGKPLSAEPLLTHLRKNAQDLYGV